MISVRLQNFVILSIVLPEQKEEKLNFSTTKTATIFRRIIRCLIFTQGRRKPIKICHAEMIGVQFFLQSQIVQNFPFFLRKNIGVLLYKFWNKAAINFDYSTRLYIVSKEY